MEDDGIGGRDWPRIKSRANQIGNLSGLRKHLKKYFFLESGEVSMAFRYQALTVQVGTCDRGKVHVRFSTRLQGRYSRDHQAGGTSNESSTKPFPRPHKPPCEALAVKCSRYFTCNRPTALTSDILVLLLLHSAEPVFASADHVDADAGDAGEAGACVGIALLLLRGCAAAAAAAVAALLLPSEVECEVVVGADAHVLQRSLARHRLTVLGTYGRSIFMLQKVGMFHISYLMEIKQPMLNINVFWKNQLKP